MSEKSLAQKLAIKPGSKFMLVNAPNGYTTQMGDLPEGVMLLSDSSSLVDSIQVFVANRAELEARLPALARLLPLKGILWVSYHKGTSKLKIDINRDTINAYANSLGLQGVAMIAIDDDWAALRLKWIET
jgi:hypothetical protein